jgi:hypothetical protein
LRDRHAANKEAVSWAEQEADAQQRWTTHVAPEAARLDTELARHQTVVEQLVTRLERHRAASRLTRERALELHRTAGRLAAGATARRPASGQTRQLRHPDLTPHHEPPELQLGPQL